MRIGDLINFIGGAAKPTTIPDPAMNASLKSLWQNSISKSTFVKLILFCFIIANCFFDKKAIRISPESAFSHIRQAYKGSLCREQCWYVDPL